MTVFEMIGEQQKGTEGSDIWMVGEQLKEICAGDPHCARLVEQDLQGKDMSLKHAAGKIKARADELHKKQKGNCVCIPPKEAERIIREFYGLPEAVAAPDAQAPKPVPGAEKEEPELLDLSEFF